MKTYVLYEITNYDELYMLSVSRDLERLKATITNSYKYANFVSIEEIYNTARSKIVATAQPFDQIAHVGHRLVIEEVTELE